ncbi:MAG: hypothetical protein AAF311_04560 [Pseudomonadota bacterium]
MILRRIRAHVEAENWFAVFLDFAIVVLGVFIGIQVANWNTAQQDRRDERATLEALHAQVLEAEALTLRRLDLRMATIRDHGRATDVLFGLAPDRALSEVECAVLAVPTTYIGRMDLPALERLQASGRIGVISDRALGDALARLIQRREALEIFLATARRPFNLMQRHSGVFEARSVLYDSLTREDPEREFEVRCDIGEIRTDPDLMNAVALNADVLDGYLRDGLRPWAEQFRTVHAELDRVLGIDHSEASTP